MALSYCCNSWFLPWPPRAYTIQGCGSARYFYSYPAKRKKNVVLVHRGRSEAHRSPGPAQSLVLGWSGTVRWLRILAICSPFRVRQSLKLHVSSTLQVLSALVSYIANVHCCVWSEKSVTYCESFVFSVYPVALNQSKEAVELNPLLQCSIWLYESGLACFSSCLSHSTLSKIITCGDRFFYFIMPWPVLITDIIVIGMLEALSPIKNGSMSW